MTNAKRKELQKAYKLHKKAGALTPKEWTDAELDKQPMLVIFNREIPKVKELGAEQRKLAGIEPPDSGIVLFPHFYITTVPDYIEKYFDIIHYGMLGEQNLWMSPYDAECFLDWVQNNSISHNGPISKVIYCTILRENEEVDVYHSSGKKMTLTTKNIDGKNRIFWERVFEKHFGNSLTPYEVTFSEEGANLDYYPEATFFATVQKTDGTEIGLSVSYDGSYDEIISVQEVDPEWIRNLPTVS